MLCDFPKESKNSKNMLTNLTQKLEKRTEKFIKKYKIFEYV